MSRWRTILVVALGAALLELSSAPAFACAACFGQSDSSLAQGMNMGILALLMVPVFFVTVQGLFNREARSELRSHAGDAGLRQDRPPVGAGRQG